MEGRGHAALADRPHRSIATLRSPLARDAQSPARNMYFSSKWTTEGCFLLLFFFSIFFFLLFLFIYFFSSARCAERVLHYENEHAVRATPEAGSTRRSNLFTPIEIVENKRRKFLLSGKRRKINETIESMRGRPVRHVISRRGSRPSWRQIRNADDLVREKLQ